ncbi:MAG: PQQ-dependent sugar dehydrogenase, partial [Bacteroidetes bacterium]|nr:PQQ-dependent sugar dehydrogenase [Bacteroidota bacterium]
MQKLLSFLSHSQKRGSLTQKFLILGLGVLFMGTVIPMVFQHGYDSPTAIGAFMNGNLPTSTPGGVTSWDVVEAFPNLTFEDPMFFRSEPGSNRLYVGERDGKILFFNNDSLTNSKTTFLDISNRVAVVWDGGLMDMVFHPRFGIDSNYVYIYYCARVPNASYSTANEGFGYPGTFFNIWGRLSRFTVNPVTHIADPASELIMINKRLYNGSHRGGSLTFDDEGYLFVAVGDEFRYQTAQEMDTTLEGGTLRIDVDQDITRSHAPIRVLPIGNIDEYSGIGYYIPNDNPWLDPSGNSFEEYYSIGHRQPHKMSYDSLTDQIWIGEVGGNTKEEVNVVHKGHNYGHPFREGTIVGSKNPPSVIVGTLTDPAIDFDHSETSVIIGGYVYRGADLPYFQGKYICGGYAQDKLWALTYDSLSGTATKELICTFTPERLCAFGTDQDNELYLIHQGPNAKVYKIAPAGAAPSAPATLSSIGAFTNLSTMEPEDGVIPYELIEPFWSDKAEKFRWMMIPNDGTHDTPAEQITFSEEGDWEFPIGAVLIKHFEMVLDETNPSIRTKLETRFLVHGTDDKYYGLTYKWRSDQSDADLLATSDIDTFTVATSGFPRQEIWEYPSRDACKFCHNEAAKGVLGPITRQLNNEIYYPATGRTANQLITLEHLGIFSPSLDTSASNLASILTSKNKYDMSASLEERARTYLDANCSSCHRPGTGNRGVFDARLQVPLEAQGFIYGNVSDEIGVTGGKVIIPGDLERSLLFKRLNDVHSGIAMPPLAKNKIDSAGVELIKEWILDIDGDFPAEGSGLQGEYYDNSNLTNLKLTRIDTEIDFYWGTSSPDTNFIGDNSYSVRWTGQVMPIYNETYTFYTNSDEGVRLYVDGVLIIDKWVNQGPTEWTGNIALTAGQKVDITLEYYEASGISLVELYWSSESQAKEIIPERYLFPPVAPTLNQAISFQQLANQDSSVDYVVLTAEASSNLPVSYQVVKGPASVSEDTLYLTGALGEVLIRASQSGNSTYLPAPAIENSFYVISNAAGSGTGLLGTYFDNSDLTNQIMLRVDKEIDFNWGSGSPDGTMDKNTFSVRWEGLIEAPYTETFTFTTNSDDGVRLWVNNILIIDEWGGQALSNHSGSIAMTKGVKVPIRLEYQELYTYSIISLSWSSPSVSPDIVPKRYLYTPNVSAFDDYAKYVDTDTAEIAVLDNDYLPVPADTSTLKIVVEPWYGTVVVDNVNGKIKYIPKAGQPDNDQFTYRFKDIAGVRSSIGTVYMSRLGTPYIIITNPANGDTAFTSSVQVDYAAEGNLTGVDHINLILNGVTPVQLPPVSGSYTFNNVAVGDRSIIAQLADAGNVPLAFDAAQDTVNFRRDTAGAATCDPLPVGWASADIGNIGATGTSCDSNNVFRLNGSGERLGSTSDGFYYVYQNLPADGEIIVRITNVAGDETSSKGFVMIREDLTPGSIRAVMAFSQDGNASFQRRLTANTNSTSTSTTSSAPIWLRLERTG